MHTVRIYGKKRREFQGYVEIEYKEYRIDGSLYGIGEEQFSDERYYKEIEERHIWTWDGTSRNKGGFRKFEYHGMVEFSKLSKKNLKEYLKVKYPDAKLIQLR